VSTSISITENKKAIELNRTATRLTYLAVIFVPLTWVSGLLSMQSDLQSLGTIIWQYAAIAFPLTLFALVLLLTYSKIVDKWEKTRLHEWLMEKVKQRKEKKKRLKDEKEKEKVSQQKVRQQKVNANGPHKARQ